MARSIGDWFADHERATLGDNQDDEIVEQQAPWDLRTSGMATTRSDRRGAGFGTKKARFGRSAGATVPPGGRGKGKPAAPRWGNSASPAARSKATPLESRIRNAANANPGLGYKKLAALLRSTGVPVTKAQVAEALARSRSASNKGAQRSRAKAKPAMIIRVKAGAQTSRTVHETPLCPSCGVRLSVIGTCRCS